jgi:DNA repair exonuclease SbcCD nuclease subunit
MTRLLHTADVHLSTDAPERRAALAEVLDLGEAEAVDFVTIGGDLFDSDADSEELRPELRQLFSDRPYTILTIPGNHDEAAFSSDLHYGESFDAAIGEPFEHVTAPSSDVRLTCVPYTAQAVDEVLIALAEREPFDGVELLLLHCSLEAPFDSVAEGDEGGRRYFPVTRETLADLGFDYLLAGHFHSPHQVDLPNGSTFVYPGSPASVTGKETGPRNLVLIDTAEEQVEFHRLDAFHYDTLDRVVTPGEEEAVLEEIARWVDRRQDRDVDASITVSGHVSVDETEFQTDLAEVSGAIPVTNRTTGVEDVLSHPLFEEFESKLAAREFDDESLRDDVWERTVSIFSELSSGGRLS